MVLQTRSLNQFACALVRQRGSAHESAFTGRASRFYQTPFMQGSNIPKTSIFSRKCPFPAKSVTSNNFSAIMDSPNISATMYVGVKESQGDVICGFGRLRAAEIDMPPLSTLEKEHMTSKRLPMGDECMRNTNKTPWSLLRSISTYDVVPVINAPLWPKSTFHHNLRSKMHITFKWCMIGNKGQGELTIF